MKPEANAKEVAKAVAKLQKYVDQVTDPKMRDEEDEIWAGVGFGPNFYKQVTVEESVYRCIYSMQPCIQPIQVFIRCIHLCKQPIQVC